MDNNVCLWEADTGKQVGRTMKGHRNFVTCIAWEPLIKSAKSNRFATSSKDQTTRIWEAASQTCLYTLGSHTASVSRVLWGGENLIYTASQDRTIKVWNSDRGMMVNDLKGHAHWVNTLALSTDYVLRTGCFDHTQKDFDSDEEKQKYAIERYNKVKDVDGGERLVSGSDDFTMFLWQPQKSNKHVNRMTGHQGLVN